MAVVADTYEQPSAFGVGKGRYRAGQLGSVLYFVFEVLLLVLALTHQVLYVLKVVHDVVKCYEVQRYSFF